MDILITVPSDILHKETVRLADFSNLYGRAHSISFDISECFTPALCDECVTVGVIFDNLVIFDLYCISSNI